MPNVSSLNLNDVYLFCYYFIDPGLGVAMNVKTEYLNEAVPTTVTKEPGAISGNKKNKNSLQQSIYN